MQYANSFGIPLPDEARGLTVHQIDRALDQTFNLSVNATTHTLIMLGSRTHDCDNHHFDDEIKPGSTRFAEFEKYIEMYDVDVFLSFESSIQIVLKLFREAYAAAGYPLMVEGDHE